MHDWSVRCVRGAKRSGAVGIVVAVATLSFSHLAVAQNDTVPRGLDWLRVQQHADGSWGPDDRLVVRDTAEVLRALKAVGPDEPALVTGRDALVAQSPVGVDLVARQLDALRDNLSETILTQPLCDLASARTTDGGWGTTQGFGTSDALDTALALRALVGTSALTNDMLVAAANRLSALQNADGGFALAAGDQSDLATSAEVLLALAALARVTDVSSLRRTLAEFVIGTQLPDGGFPTFPGGSNSDVRTSALLVHASIEAGANIASAYPSARAYLQASQSDNGSWEDSAYTTALALLAFGKALPDLMVAKVEVNPTTAPRGSEVTLNISVANLGLADAPSTLVTIYLGDPNAGGWHVEDVAVPAVAAGGMAGLTARVSTALTVEASLAYFVVVDPQNQVSESCETNNRGSAVVQIAGFVPPPTDQGPKIISTPPPRASVGSVFTYQIQAVDPEGDAIWYNSLYGPAGMSVDAYTGLVTWPVNVPAGTRVVAEVGALDWNYAGDAQGFSIEVTGPGVTWPPVIESYPSSAAVVGQPYLYAIQARDPDGGPVTLTLAAGPAGMTINQSTKVLSWTPTAADTGDNIVRVVATDAENATAEQQWTVVVEPISSLKPDLVLVKVDASLSPTDPQSLHRDGAVVVSVANQGTAGAGTFSVLVYEDRDGVTGYSPANDVMLGTSSVDALAASAATDVVVAVSGTALFRDNRLAAVVDPDSAIDELREDNNDYISGEDKRFVPTPGPFAPSVKAQLVTPWALTWSAIVAPLYDDNGDGHVGAGDTPYLFARSLYEGLHAYNARTGTLAWSVGCDSEVTAIGDIDRDGRPEIFCATSAWGGELLQAFDSNGVLRWKSGFGTASRTAIALYDLEGDGKAEVITNLGIIETDGVLRCKFDFAGVNVSGSGAGPPHPIVGDFDLDGVPEILVSVFAFRPDCSTIWSHPELSAGVFGAAAGQLDDDPQAEIAVTNAQGLTVLEHDGTIKWQRPPVSGLSHTGTYVGPPAIGDIDGDGQAEVVYGDRFNVQAWERDGTVRWVNAAVALGGAVAPTLADLDGDGKVEVVYGSGGYLQIFRGRDGTQIFSYPFAPGGSTTPVADVDGDGHVEIVVTSRAAPFEFLVLGNPNWAPGRGIWNQLTYHINNINDDLTIPRQEQPSWLVHGTYRAQQTTAKPVCEGTDCETQGTADLTASFIRIDRTLCPATAKYTVRVGNGGLGSVPAGTKVRFAQTAGGSSSMLGDVSTSKVLGPGEYEDVSLTAAGRTDFVQLTVTVDPGQTIADARLDNNVHSFSFGSCSNLDNQAPHFVTTPPLSARANQEWVYFPQAIDPDGDRLTFQLTTAPVGMTGPSGDGAVLWMPTLEQLGPQEVALQVTDGRGGTDVQSFVVDVMPPALVPSPPPPAVANLVLNVSTDRNAYGPGQAASITTTVQNQGQAGRTGRLRVELQDAAGLVLATPLESQAILFVGTATQTVPAAFDTGVLLVGTYSVVAIYDEGTAESRAEAGFTVTGAPSLAATVATERLQYGANESVRITGTMQNTSANAILAGLVPRLQVLDASGSVVAAQTFDATDLAPSGLQRPEMVFDTGLQPAGAYRVLFDLTQVETPLASAEAHFTIVTSAQRGLALAGDIVASPSLVPWGTTFSLAGVVNNVGNAALTGLSARLQVVDPATAQAVRDQSTSLDLAMGTDTSLQATWSAVGLLPKSYIARLEVALAGRSLLSVATELVVDPGPPPVVSVGAPACSSAGVTPTIAVTGGASPVVQLVFLDGLAYDGTQVTGEGSHVIEVQVTDAAGRTATASASFIIDRTPPVLAVSGVADGGAYASAVTPAIVAADPHLTGVQASLNGADYVSGTTIAIDGTYTLQASARDCAGNQAMVATSFVIDTTPPQIVIDVPACSAGTVTPVVTVVEAHVATEERLLDGQPYDGSAVTSEGKHTLKVTVTDTAGNKTTRSVDFTVDNTAPTITLTGVESGKAYRSPVTPEVVFQDAVEITLTLNGKDFISGTTVSDDGAYVLAATARDCAGNSAKLDATFQIDTVAPAVSIDVPSCQANTATPVVTVTEAHVASDERLLDGEAWDGLLVTAEGTHTLDVAVTDTAGNRTQAGATFVIDNTRPVIQVSGVTDGGWYKSAVSPVVTFDEANLTSSTLDLDAQGFQSGTPVESAGPHVLTVTATDCAGNSATSTTSFTLDFTPPVLVVGDVPPCTAAATVVPVATADEPVTLDETLDGAPYAPGVPIAAEGSHVLVVAATDRAGNVTTETRNLVIDRTPPQITFTGVANGAAYRTAVAPAVSVVDPNLVGTSLLLDGRPYLDQTPIGVEGAHTLAAVVTDCAGNTANLSAAFLIDLTAPVASIAGLQGCSQGPARPTIAASDLNEPLVLPTRTCTLDSQTLPSCDGLSIAAEGTHTLTATATDRAGNTSLPAQVSFTVDDTAPRVTIAGVTDGASYNTTVAPVVSATDQNLVSLTATLNGQPFASGSTIAIDGWYTLNARADDCAGHVVSAAATFLVDTAPASEPVSLFLHGGPATDNPATLWLDVTPPSAASARYKDSSAVNFNNGNPWKLIGTWNSSAGIMSGSLATVSDLHVWLGLKNSDDIGTQFDLRAEVLRNGVVVTTGEGRCVTGITRNPSLAKEVTVSFGAFAPVHFDGNTDVLSLRLSTRIGTTPEGAKCPGPGGSHNNAVGLRLYFDTQTRNSRLEGSLGCAPTSCSAQNKNCGAIPDGCGGGLDCGTCVAPQTCGGGGTPHLCGTAESASMIAYWTFDNDSARDIVGGHDGTIVGVGFTNGIVGRAASFPNGFEFIRIPSFHTDYITVEAWIKPAKYGNYTSMVTKNHQASGWDNPYASWQLWLADTYPNPAFYTTSGLVRMQSFSPTSVPMNDWSHVVGTYDGQNVRIYVNGVLQASTPASGPMEVRPGDIYIGRPEYSNHTYSGLIDEVAIYNQALSAAEIAQHYQNGLNGQGYLANPNPPAQAEAYDAQVLRSDQMEVQP